jgi:two-component system response regulator AtoC
MASNSPLAMGFQGVAANHLPPDDFFVSGKGGAMRSLERVLGQVAATDIPVLLVGESGTGKEELAVRIHQLSGRQSSGLIKLICASLSAENLEDLIRESNGAAPSAAGPTVFLDEIADLSMNCQTRLLHYLPNGDAIQNSSVLRGRVVSSTSYDIEEEVRAGRFRKELYYRLKGVILRLPPLRERKEDIPPLVESFLAKHSRLLGLPRPPVSPRTIRLLQDYAWPGNIRELENLVRKMVALADEGVALADLDPASPAGFDKPGHAERISLKEAGRAASRQAERELIQRVLTRVRWNRKRAAQELQISYKALLYKLKQMGLDGSNG